MLLFRRQINSREVANKMKSRKESKTLTVKWKLVNEVAGSAERRVKKETGEKRNCREAQGQECYEAAVCVSFLVFVSSCVTVKVH